MILFKRAGDLTRWLDQQRISGKLIGFVPTMGALHAGHISLITISKKSAGVTVCSIFVNPTQFNDPKDFQKYPITLEKDIALLEQSGTDVLFLPEVEEVYPEGTSGLEHYDLGRIETLLEGQYRPGHFQGVCQVMRRLLDVVRPDDLFMGQKDYQQCMVLQRLLELRGMPTRLHRCPILREPDGLAMSSRNMRLTPDQRQKAAAIYKALQSIRDSWTGAERIATERPAAKPISALVTAATGLLETAGFRVDYVSIADATTLEPLDSPPANPRTELPLLVSAAPSRVLSRPAGLGHAVALIAAFLGEVRLIDNLELPAEPSIS
jgi:pantoate--beta-alanine ligase